MLVQTSNQAKPIPHTTLPSLDDHIALLIEKDNEHTRNLMRPPVAPVYGVCGHVARSAEHTCGAYRCTEIYGC